MMNQRMQAGLWIFAFFALALLGTSRSQADEAAVAEHAARLPFPLTDLAGVVHWPAAEKGTSIALVFLSDECPIARSYIPTLNELAGEFKEAKSGVRFYGVVSDPTVSRAAAREFVSEFAIEYPVLFDASGQLAAALQPTHLPEVFVLSGGELIYRGRIDNRYAQIGRRRPEATEHDLQRLLRSVAAGEPAQFERTQPVGCLFEAWRPRGSKPREITFNRDVAPVLEGRCIRCHRGEGSKSFALTTWKQAAGHAARIAALAAGTPSDNRATTAAHAKVLGNEGLTRFERQLLVDWHKQGAAEGKASELAPRFAERAGGKKTEPAAGDDD